MFSIAATCTYEEKQMSYMVTEAAISIPCWAYRGASYAKDPWPKWKMPRREFTESKKIHILWAQ